MTNVYLIGFADIMKSIYFFSLVKVGLGVSLLLWQQLFFPSGLLRFCRSCQTVPYLLLELRLRLNLHYWVARLSGSMLRSFGNAALHTSTARHDYLPFRDGRKIFDFFKTLAVSDVSPPEPA